MGNLIIKQESLLKKSWDVLFILDACRFDMFEQVYESMGLSGKLRCVDSEAIETDHWYQKHWSGHNNEIILVTPHARLFKNSHYKNFFGAINTSGIPEQDDWRSPEMAVKVFTDSQKENKDKRFIVHLIPPHLPFLGKCGRAWLEDIGLFKHPDYKRIASMCNAGDIKWDKIKEYYLENIRFSLGFIKDSLEKIQGKIVITSDHGDLLGENGLFGHGYEDENVREILTTVPWLELNNEKDTLDS